MTQQERYDTLALLTWELTPALISISEDGPRGTNPTVCAALRQDVLKIMDCRRSYEYSYFAPEVRMQYEVLYEYEVVVRVLRESSSPGW